MSSLERIHLEQEVSDNETGDQRIILSDFEGVWYYRELGLKQVSEGYCSPYTYQVDIDPSYFAEEHTNYVYHILRALLYLH